MNEYEITVSGKDLDNGDSVKVKIIVDTTTSLWDVVQTIRGKAQRIASQSEIKFPESTSIS